MDNEFERAKKNIKRLLTYRLISEIFLTLFLSFAVCFGICVQRSDEVYEGVQPIMQPQLFNSLFKQYVGENQSKNLAVQFVQTVMASNLSREEHIVAVKYFSKSLCVYTDLKEELNIIIEDIKKNNNRKYSCSINKVTDTDYIAVVEVISSDYKGDNTNIEEKLSKDFLRENNLKEYTPQNTTSNVPHDRKSGYSTRNVVLSIGITILALICIIILILKYKKSLKTKLNEDDLGKILKKERRNVIVLTIIIILGISVEIIYNFYQYSSSVAKPIIYIYPQEETRLVVKARYPELFTCTYPKYDNEGGWHVVAEPDGTLFNLAGKDNVDLDKTQKLYSLYWEGNNPNIDTSMDVGFCVKGEDVAEFLEEKLTKLGLNYKEQEEFIVYWLPKLEKNKYNFIRFATTEECNKFMPLEFTEILNDGSTREAQVDNLIRILMIYKPLDKEIDVEEQIINTPSRDGFTVIEWGGSEI